MHQVDVPEWLSGMTRNHVGSARAGSNPAVHVFLYFFHFQLPDIVVYRIQLLSNYFNILKIIFYNTKQNLDR